MKKKTDGNQDGSLVASGYVEEIGAGRIEDEGGDGVVLRGKAGCERCASACSIGNDVLGGKITRGCEVLPGRVRVVGEALLAGARCGALTVAAVVKGEDVQAEVVEAGEGGNRVCERAVAIGEEEDGEVGVAAAGVCGNPPTGELWRGGLVRAEADDLVGDAGDRCWAGGGADWVQDKLPLALIEEQAEGEIATEKCSKNGGGDRLDQPDGADVVRGIGLRCSAVVCLVRGRCGRARHRSFHVDFSILRSVESFLRVRGSNIGVAED